MFKKHNSLQFACQHAIIAICTVQLTLASQGCDSALKKGGKVERFERNLEAINKKWPFLWSIARLFSIHFVMMMAPFRMISLLVCSNWRAKRLPDFCADFVTQPRTTVTLKDVRKVPGDIAQNRVAARARARLPFNHTLSVAIYDASWATISTEQVVFCKLLINKLFWKNT